MTREETKKAIEIMQAFVDGKEIECDNSGYFTTNNPIWNWYDLQNKYRVKPEPKLRPYKDAKEFLEAQQKHGLYIERDGNFYFPSVINEEGVSTYGIAICPWESILRYYTWLDGTPCGIME